MKKNAMRRNLRQSIWTSFGRYVAISAIIALGAGLFVGLLMSKSDMVATGQKFMDEQNMFDLRMISNYGWTDEYVESFAELDGIEAAEGLYYVDLVARIGEKDDSVYRFYTLPQNMNQVALRGGRMPQADNECLADGFYWNDDLLGKTVTISPTNDEDSLETICHQTFTIVGYVSTPLYMDMNRGTTAIGSGSLENYYYVPSGAFDVDYYTEIHLTLEGNHEIYTDEYRDALDDTLDRIEPEAEKLSQKRFDTLKEEIEEEYQEGYQEYLDGVKEYEEGKAEAEQELADAEAELNDAQKKVDDGYDQLLKADIQIHDGYKQIEDKRTELYNNRVTLIAQLEQVKANIPAAEAGVAQAEQMIGMSGAELQTSIASAQQNLALTQQGVSSAQQALNTAQQNLATVQANPEATPDEIAAAQAAVTSAESALSAATTAQTEAQGALNSLNGLNAIYSPAASALSTLLGTKGQLEAGLQEIDAGFAMLDEMEQELISAENRLDIKWGEWGIARDELKEGWADFEEAKIEVAQELADGEKELKDAEEDLKEAREEIDAMEEPDLIMLDRTSNVGYSNLSSSSDIVAGVSRVLPVFFLLVASLVCITTMTRMIDEERTQIGTLKALGYSNAEIMSKYLIYSGSGAVLGCSLGILAGCTIFPMIIWKAYCIMLYIQPGVVLTINWLLSAVVVLVYTAVMLLVTWYSCHKTLEEEPAELIRPKAPDAGKKIFLENLPFWHKISFLNKVTIRNIFRYRQRLAMMLIGIGGCTALLLTGFGLQDTIVNIVDFQFRDVTHYDLSVYFRDELNEKEAGKFKGVVADKAENYMFYHQSSVELEFVDGVKEIYMISGDRKLEDFIDLHKREEPLSLPGMNEVVLSVGVAENLGIGIQDTIILRNADMQELELTVSGIYDNYIYNYAIVAPGTIEQQWGNPPELQMAFVKVKEGCSVHGVSAAITDFDFVMNVSISEDIAEMVGGMMDALDLVVMVIVFSAGLLAVIVLYNLTNININERIREIATIKVLGFNASETGAYVFKENMVLTVVGSLFGLLLGKLLLAFVISQIKIDMVWFRAATLPMSYVWSIGLTLLSAVVVDFIFYFKLDKINMAEALKSVE